MFEHVKQLLLMFSTGQNHGSASLNLMILKIRHWLGWKEAVGRLSPHWFVAEKSLLSHWQYGPSRNPFGKIKRLKLLVHFLFLSPDMFILQLQPRALTFARLIAQIISSLTASLRCLYGWDLEDLGSKTGIPTVELSAICRESIFVMIISN